MILKRFPFSILTLAVLLASPGFHAEAADKNQAALIIAIDLASPVTYCVELPSSPLSGLDFLKMAKIAVDAAPIGTICKIQKTGCPTSDCFCKCKAKPCQFWGYLRRPADQKAWAPSKVGATSVVVQPGDTEAWIWAKGDLQALIPKLEKFTYLSICAETK